jgi:tetratricopeptide (TPR) repeat protein
VRQRTTLLVGGALAVALALGSLVGGVLAEPSPPAELTATPRALVDPALAAAGGGAVGPSAVARLESEVRVRPGDASLLTQLGFAYQLRWRETADPSFLPRSEAALRRALRADPGDPNAILGLGSLALIRHEFRAALSYGRRARRVLPGSGRPYGVIGDALVELGRYDAAFAAFQRMVTLRPNLASYARVAYARELSGDLEGALDAMRLALGAAGGQPEPTAFTLVESAKLENLLGRSRAAQQHARAALRAVPGYPAARLVLARLDARAGRLARAVAGARRAADAIPTPESVALLADLLDRTERRAEARTARRTVAAMDRLLEASGIQVDLESAAFRADLGIRPRETVRLARRARAERPSIFGDDALGWALARAGRCREALPLLERSLRLGTKDPLLFFHRGYAEGCAGNRPAMRAWYERALALDPEFSLRWAPVARAALER